METLNQSDSPYVQARARIQGMTQTTEIDRRDAGLYLLNSIQNIIESPQTNIDMLSNETIDFDDDIEKPSPAQARTFQALPNPVQNLILSANAVEYFDTRTADRLSKIPHSAIHAAHITQYYSAS
jgi:hypothetical protein